MTDEALVRAFEAARAQKKKRATSAAKSLAAKRLDEMTPDRICLRTSIWRGRLGPGDQAPTR